MGKESWVSGTLRKGCLQNDALHINKLPIFELVQVHNLPSNFNYTALYIAVVGLEECFRDVSSRLALPFLRLDLDFEDPSLTLKN